MSKWERYRENLLCRRYRGRFSRGAPCFREPWIKGSPKLTSHRDQSGASMLFDRKKDPFEMNNVFGTRDYANVQARLTRKIVAWQKQTSDELSLPVNA